MSIYYLLQYYAFLLRKTCNLIAKIIKNTILCKFLISYFSFSDKKLVFLGIFEYLCSIKFDFDLILCPAERQFIILNLK